MAKQGECAVCRKVTKLVRGSGMCAKCWKLRQAKRGR
jgi:hypothetical protein